MLLCPGISGFPMTDEEEEAMIGADNAAATMADFKHARAAGDVEDPPVYARLGEITVPAALMVGDADYPPLVKVNRQAAARIPGCEFLLVPGMDHFPPLREPDAALGLITRTLARANW